MDQRTAISTVLQMSGGHVGCQSFQCAVLKVLLAQTEKRCVGNEGVEAVFTDIPGEKSVSFEISCFVNRCQ